jgi:hypothetical protein
LKKYLPSQRDVLLVVLILVVAFSTQYFSQYFSTQMITSPCSQSPSQPIELRPMELPTSPLLIVPSPSPSITPNVAPSIQPTPAPTPAPTDQPHDSAIAVAPSPSPTSDPLSVLKLSLYRSNPVQSQQVLQNIDWGQIVPGQKSNSQTIYFRNEGSMPLTMSFSPVNWVFKDASGNSLPQNYSQYFTLTWNYDNSPINVNEVRPLVFTLAVSSSLKDVASFSFNLVITITSTN